MADELVDVAGHPQAEIDEPVLPRRHRTRDEKGRLTLLDRPVYICPSLANIGAGNLPVLFGNLKRFIVRSVFAEQTVNKYQDVFMLNHQIGFEGVWRADASLATASNTDGPIVALRNPLS